MTQPTEVEVVNIRDEPIEIEVLDYREPDPLEGAEIVSVGADRSTTGSGGTGSAVRSFQHHQFIPSMFWLIFHQMTFEPAGIIVIDDVDGHRMYPSKISRPAPQRVRLDFTHPVAGTAYLS